LVEQKGLQLADESRELILGLSEQHRQHLLRYHFVINPFMPAPAKVWSMLDELLLLTRISTYGH